ncbi:hypothetical protein, unlikely [Trypanosoma brucei gambiense DAL972]|uniref:Uncharacterized protein n=1 Tax=Trypanosoma brucei gambiense (strain MHOM/CI/86/DAL972) TaxID=679716 RepID=C9ZYU3_TRYB9|nr:hypothetical protein, unlikely [Trypanosoma brucei gambiense DAL972]CBH14592.1 hypothetical protein, unlikely [Trypanosoma brucei gambiense DAL972]|eukprot:XP_011776858.1 hypothetical protein, unlikely [Trypanosoma brucei gambiense DAL972]
MYRPQPTSSESPWRVTKRMALAVLAYGPYVLESLPQGATTTPNCQTRRGVASTMQHPFTTHNHCHVQVWWWAAVRWRSHGQPKLVQRRIKRGGQSTPTHH